MYPTPEVLAADQKYVASGSYLCKDSPTKAHYWRGEQTGPQTCKYCGELKMEDGLRKFSSIESINEDLYNRAVTDLALAERDLEQAKNTDIAGLYKSRVRGLKTIVARYERMKEMGARTHRDITEAKEKKPRTPRSPKELHECLCGCGKLVAGRFAQGHDSTFKSLIKKLKRNQIGMESLSPLMQKMVNEDHEEVRKVSA